MRCNVNVLGEAILGDEEAGARLDAVLARLARPDVDYVSVKISAVCASVERARLRRHASTGSRDRLRALYRASRRHSTRRSSSTSTWRSTATSTSPSPRSARCSTSRSSAPRRRHRAAGLPARLPRRARELGDWAAARRGRGGAPIKLRIVKGANLAMERIEAELHGWPQAPYATKAEVDANYKRSSSRCRPGARAAVHLGIASHNLFDVA